MSERVDEFKRVEPPPGMTLKKCPFCGAEAELWERTELGGSVSKAVMCSSESDDDCPLYLAPEALYKATKREAVEAWNRRVGGNE